jgi:hypothetical protein
MQDNEQKKKRKSGLHKEISSIFEGISVPGAVERPSGAAAPEQIEQGATRPPAQGPHIPQIAPPAKPGPVPKAVVAKKSAKSTWRKTWQKIKIKLFKSESGNISTRQKVTLILIPILSIALIYVLMPLVRRPKISEPKREALATAAVDYKGEVDWKIPEPYPVTLRDPMQPNTAGTINAEAEAIEAGKIASFIVKGIIHSDDNPAAVVGTQIVHEGDVISGVSIVKINQDSVEFQMNDKRWAQKVQR